MTFADKLKVKLNRIRSRPGKLGLRPYSVAALDVYYGDEFTGGAGYETPITEAGGHNPKVRWLTAEEIAVGGYGDNTVQVGPITPGDGTVGTLLETIFRDPGDGNVARFRLTGPQYPNGANYALTKISTDRALHYTLTLERSA